jgi:hypothetical protein
MDRCNEAYGLKANHPKTNIYITKLTTLGI